MSSPVLAYQAIGGGSGDKDSLTKKLDAKHPEYLALEGAWTDIDLMYRGGVSIAAQSDRFLKKRPAEETTVYDARVEQFSYNNLIGTVLGLYESRMFKEEPEISFKKPNGEDLPSGQDEFWRGQFSNNCDRRGTPLGQAFKTAFSDLLQFGRFFVLTDLPAQAEGEKPLTLLDQRNKGLLDPYLVFWRPLDVINWGLDEDDNLEWVVIKTCEDKTKFKGGVVRRERWYYYDKEQYEVYEREYSIDAKESEKPDAVLRNSGKHALSSKKRCPVRMITCPDSLWLAHRAYLPLLNHLNLDNSLNWALFMSNLAMPVIITDAQVSDIQASEAGFLRLPAGSEYKWSEPAGTSFTHSAQRIAKIEQQIFESCYLAGMARPRGKTDGNQSGYSKELELEPSMAVLCAFGVLLRHGVIKVVEDAVLAREESGDEVKVEVGGLKFVDQMTIEEVVVAQDLLNLRVPSDEFERQIFVAVVQKFMRGASKDSVEKIMKDLAAAPIRWRRLLESEIEAAELAAQSKEDSPEQASLEQSARPNPKGGLGNGGGGGRGSGSSASAARQDKNVS